MAADAETVEGYVVDLACVRKYRRDELLDRARRHTRECALMPHCLESGYALVEDRDRLIPLDSHATPLIRDAILATKQSAGIRLRVARRRKDGEMQTQRVELVRDRAE